MGSRASFVQALNLVGVPEVVYIMVCEGVGWTCGRGMGKGLFLMRLGSQLDGAVSS